jgi:hypothetical protein
MIRYDSVGYGKIWEQILKRLKENDKVIVCRIYGKSNGEIEN